MKKVKFIGTYNRYNSYNYSLEQNAWKNCFMASMDDIGSETMMNLKWLNYLENYLENLNNYQGISGYLISLTINYLEILD